jgi:hypothetical protein
VAVSVLYAITGDIKGITPETIESMLAQDERARIEWDATHEVCIDYPLVVAMKSQLGLTDEQIRELFATASEL